MTTVPDRVPRHIAIIMDGNGRWAQARDMQRVQGHARGVDSVRTVTRACARLGVEALTLYSFSSENWGRPEAEVEALMALLEHYLNSEREEILSNDIRLMHSGDTSALPRRVREALASLEEASSGCNGMRLNLALSYGSRQELIRAFRSLISQVEAGKLDAVSVDEDAIEAELYTAGLPELDLLVRSGGEMRISNFLLWQAAYSEIYVTDTPWPDFGEKELLAAIAEFNRRQRRYGLTGQQIEDSL
jgi:undecaprenyl diphosphate synthase